MNITITPGLLHGTITPPPSKSQAHRLIISAALAQGESHLSNVALSQDIIATLRCMRALGAEATEDGSVIRGVGENRYPCTPCCDTPGLFCGESGSTLRFLIPVALAVRQGGSFHGEGRLMQRPLEPYEKIFDEKGISYHRHGDQMEVYGKLTPGEYKLAGDVSSQFITGLLYALPLLEGDSEIVLTTPLESRGYVDMTLNALRASGITILPTERGWKVPGNQTYLPYSGAVEGDYSQAGFFYAAKGLGSDLTIQGMNPDSAQGDRVIAEYYEKLLGDGEVELDVSQCPDLVPPLAAHAALRPPGAVTHIVGAARLRIKESDRLASVTQVLNALGAQVEEGADYLTITAVEQLHGGTVSSYNDHRIAMMAAIAATRATEPVTVLGAECVRKSYPNFWEDYEKLGGQIRREEET
jgi:3-phosphoshikimate 1-carboxyvinyltransferase